MKEREGEREKSTLPFNVGFFSLGFVAERGEMRRKRSGRSRRGSRIRAKTQHQYKEN